MLRNEHSFRRRVRLEAAMKGGFSQLPYTYRQPACVFPVPS
jgi:hypothetical protein